MGWNKTPISMGYFTPFAHFFSAIYRGLMKKPMYFTGFWGPTLQVPHRFRHGTFFEKRLERNAHFGSHFKRRFADTVRREKPVVQASKSPEKFWTLFEIMWLDREWWSFEMIFCSFSHFGPKHFGDWSSYNYNVYNEEFTQLPRNQG